MDDPEDLPPPATAKPSTIPSWVMLGFVLGVLTMLVLPRSEKKPAAPVTVTLVAPPKPAPEKPTVERAAFFEAVFAEYSHLAVWQGDVTEVAFFDATRKAFSDCYEVMKAGDKFYFRSIPHLTRPVLTEGVPSDSPLQFTVPGDAKLQQEKAFQAMWNLKPGPINPAPVLPPPVPAAAPPADKLPVEILQGAKP